MDQNAPWTLERVLKWTKGYFKRKGSESPRLDAELIIAHALNVDRMRLYLDHHKPLSPTELGAVRALVDRRGKGEPVAYITGTKAFWTIELNVDGRVLIPRPETEHVVEHGLKAIEDRPDPLIADVGCGSGCIALAVASSRTDSQVTAIDSSDDALTVARKNAETLALPNVEFKKGDLLTGVQGTFDLILSNPPYIPTAQIAELMSSVRDFEPVMALDGGTDGLDIYRRLASQVADRLKPNGSMLFEIGFDQGAAVTTLLEETGRFTDIRIHKDYAGLDRVVAAILADDAVP